MENDKTDFNKLVEQAQIEARKDNVASWKCVFGWHKWSKWQHKNNEQFAFCFNCDKRKTTASKTTASNSKCKHTYNKSNAEISRCWILQGERKVGMHYVYKCDKCGLLNSHQTIFAE